MPKLIRITTVPMSLKLLLPGQMRYMSEQGFEVVMVSSDGPEREHVIVNEKCPHVVIPMTRSITPLQDIRSLVALYRLFKKEKPDIVHSHTPKAGLLSMVAAKMAGINVRIHTIAGLRFQTTSGLTRRVLVGMEKLTAASATHVWPNSESLIAYIRQHRLVAESKLAVIAKGSSNGIDLTRFNRESLSSDGIERAKAIAGYEPGLIYLLVVGRLVKDKGISELAVAFETLARKEPKLRLLLIGGMEEKLDPLDPHTLNIINTNPAIIVAGWRNDVENYMAFASMLVHPSYREGFPNVILQAGALGLPVICSRIEGNIDLVTDKETGMLFEAKNVLSLEHCLTYAILHPEEINVFASQLSQKVKNYYNRSFIHESIKNKYLAILNAGT
ncbi:MAG: glycosyltransferase family 4 protein [Chitinophagaceae bacterium]